MRGPLREEASAGGFAGGLQVAIVKVSTSLRMKKRGKVPPKLETLNMLILYGYWGLGDIRSKEGHISAPYDRICDLGVESGDSDEHHCAAECGEDVGRNYCE